MQIHHIYQVLLSIIIGVVSIAVRFDKRFHTWVSSFMINGKQVISAYINLAPFKERWSI